jgi:hypothetical protein
MASSILEAFAEVGQAARETGVPLRVVESVAAAIEPVCHQQIKLAPEVARARPPLL